MKEPTQCWACDLIARGTVMPASWCSDHGPFPPPPASADLEALNPTMMSALDALAEGPLPGLAVDNIARFAAKTLREYAAHVASLTARLAASEEKVAEQAADLLAAKERQVQSAQRLAAAEAEISRETENCAILVEHIDGSEVGGVKALRYAAAAVRSRMRLRTESTEAPHDPA